MMLVLKSQMEKARKYWLNSKSYLSLDCSLPCTCQRFAKWSWGSLVCRFLPQPFVGSSTGMGWPERRFSRLLCKDRVSIVETLWQKSNGFLQISGWNQVQQEGSNKAVWVCTEGWISSLPQIPASWTAYIYHCSAICWWYNCIRPRELWMGASLWILFEENLLQKCNHLIVKIHGPF